jgi:predicted MFS family arabinose efflux permease
MLIGGTSGALAATQPTLLLAEAIGWRNVFFITSGLLALAALTIFKNIPDIDLGHIKAQNDAKKESVTTPKMSLITVLRHPNMLRVIPTTLTMSGGFIALQSLGWPLDDPCFRLVYQRNWHSSFLF